MTIQQGKETEYQKYKELNSTDDYSKAIVDYAERWADLMEPLIAQGKTMAEIADKMSHTADVDGITGFMYGCAVKSLAHFWVHGEALRRWHNKEWTGDEHADSKGVANPAIVTIKV